MKGVCEIRERIRYADTDQMGVVHHAKYLEYFEIGRTEFMRRLGMPYSEVEKRGIFLAIIEAYVKYHKSAKYDNTIVIQTGLKEAGRVKVRLDYKVCYEDGSVLAEGYTVLAPVNREGKVVRLPDWLRRIFEEAR
ncbi:MAG: acyl-CoA thioesterase [Planctomycetota bacterium]|nr:acyl-CoA thioesterase [Planctomycetota bacterium]